MHVGCQPGRDLAKSRPASKLDDPEVLLKGLDSRHPWFIGVRAAQLLAAPAAKSPRLCAALAKRLADSGNEGLQMGLVPALGSAGKPAAEAIVRLLSDETTSSDVWPRFLATLGRIGPDASCAGPLLLKKLNHPETPPNLQAGIRVVLANIRVPKAAELRAIEKDLQTEGDQSQAAVWMMAWGGGPRWADAGVGRQLLKMLGQESAPTQPFAAVAVSGLPGSKSLPVVASLRRAFESAIKKTDACDYIVIGVALARAEPGAAQKYLTQVARRFGAPGGGGRFAQVALLWVGGMLPDAALVGNIGELLRSKDTAVLRGAIAIASALGIEAEPLGEQLFGILTGHKDRDLRKTAALALGRVLASADADKLEGTLKKEKSDGVREMIIAGVKIIRMGQWKPKGTSRSLTNAESERWCFELLQKNLAEVGDDPAKIKKMADVELHHVVYAGYVDSVKLLLSKGANPNLRGAQGNTLLHYASRGPFNIPLPGDEDEPDDVAPPKEVLELLIAHGADVNAKNTDGATPLHAAAWGGRHDAVKVLLAAGAKVGVGDYHGDTPLYLAVVQSTHAKTVEALLAGGAASTESNKRLLPSMLKDAKKKGRKAIVSLLKKYGAKE